MIEASLTWTRQRPIRRLGNFNDTRSSSMRNREDCNSPMELVLRSLVRFVLASTWVGILRKKRRAVHPGSESAGGQKGGTASRRLYVNSLELSRSRTGVRGKRWKTRCGFRKEK